MFKRTPPAEILVKEPVVNQDNEDDRWGEAAERQLTDTPALGWLDNGFIVNEYVWPLIFGDAVGTTWGEKAATAFKIPQGGRWLSLGCGGGDLEMQMSLNGLFDSMDALDLSPRAIWAAEKAAAERGISNINFQVGDTNRIKLPRASYDVVHMNMSLHHVSTLERLAHQVNKTLKPEGIFLANEFVGPNQFQYPAHQIELVAAELRALDDRLKWNPIAKHVKYEYPVFSRKHWTDSDPTESIRSDEIPDVLKRNFPGLKSFPYGGTILNLLLENIVQNFDTNDPKDESLLRDLMDYEQSLIQDGTIQSDFVYFYCPRGPRLARLRGRITAKLDLRHRVTMSLRDRMLR